jgi:RNA polymerase sigma factor (sigma-70 family)
VDVWRVRLAEGDVDLAWDLFLEQFHRLIFATIHHHVSGDEDARDVFAHVCQALAANGLTRLKRFQEREQAGARFSTWLVTVVHNLVIDWLRQRKGRRRRSIPQTLSPLQQEIFNLVFLDLQTHAEAYELVRARGHAIVSFAEFLREVALTYRALEQRGARGVMRYFAATLPLDGLETGSGDQGLAHAELARRIAESLQSLPADERLAVQLFVVDELPAGEVAKIVGWPNAKAVYNRVYRALARLRAELQRAGLGLSDLAT